MFNKQLLATPYRLIAFSFLAGVALAYAVGYFHGYRLPLIPLLSGALSVLIALWLPFWQTFFVNIPRLSVEITSIERNVSKAAVTAIRDDPELAPLTPEIHSERPHYYVSAEDRKAANKALYTLEELEDLITQSKQRLRELPAQIEERKKDVDRITSLTANMLTKYECERLARPFDFPIELNSDDPQKTLEELREAYRKRLEKLEERYISLQSHLPQAEKKIEKIKTELISNRSYFTISASIVNSGKSNTSIKAPALLRVFIGEGNYIDIKLTLNDFESKSDISAGGTKIVIFESPEVSSFPEEDRKLINIYWGQSVSSRLFLEDINSDIHASNTISFAEGLYQKIIYDSLARAASQGVLAGVPFRMRRR